MERVTVTAAGSWLGQALVDYLRRRAFWVRAVDRQDTETSANEHLQFDLTRSEDAYRAVAGAGHLYLLDGWGPAGLSERMNVVSNVLRAATAGTVTRIFYPVPPAEVRESPELRLLADAEAQGLEVRVGVLPTVYGPWQGPEPPAESPVHQLAMAAAGQPSELGNAPDGSPAFFCYLPDCVEAIYLLMRSNHRRPLLLAHHEPADLRTVARVLSSISGRPLAFADSGDQPGRAVEPSSVDLRSILGWTPPTHLRTGLSLLYEQIKSGSGPTEVSHG